MNKEEFEELLRDSFSACIAALDRRLKDGMPEESESWYADGWIDKLLERYKNQGWRDDRIYQFLGDFAAVHPQNAEAMYDLSLEAMRRDLVRYSNDSWNYESKDYLGNFEKSVEGFGHFFQRDRSRELSVLFSAAKEVFANGKAQACDGICAYISERDSTLAHQIKNFWDNLPETIENELKKTEQAAQAHINKYRNTFGAHQLYMRQVSCMTEALPVLLRYQPENTDKIVGLACQAASLALSVTKPGKDDPDLCSSLRELALACPEAADKFTEIFFKCSPNFERREYRRYIEDVLPELVRHKPEQADKMVDLYSKAVSQALSAAKPGEDREQLWSGMKEIALALPKNDDKNFQKICNLYDLLVSSGYGNSDARSTLGELAVARPEAADRLAEIFCKFPSDFRTPYLYPLSYQKYYREAEQWKKRNFVKPGTIKKLSDLSSQVLSTYAGLEEWSKISDKDFIKLYAKRDYQYDYSERDMGTAWLVERIMPKMAKDPMLFATYAKRISERGVSFEECKKLLEIMNRSAEQKLDENDLHHLKGMSLYEFGDRTEKGSFIHKAADFLVSNGNLSGLYAAFLTAPDTPAAQAVKEAGIERFGEPAVNFIAEHVNDIKKVPYKKFLLDAESVSYGSARRNKEANFLDAYTEELKNLAQDKYGQKEDDWYCLSKAAKHPKFLEDAGKLWNKMFEKVDDVSIAPNWHNNAYVREMFPEQMKELRQHTSNESSVTNAMESKLEYLKRVAQMSKAIKEYEQDKDVSLNGNLHFDLANAGIDNFKDAKRCLDIWEAVNERPDSYGSPYNEFSIGEIAKIAKIPVKEAWMYPVMINAIRKGGFSVSDRAPSERTLFDACKAWKICPEMPQRLAEKVGKHGLYGRMFGAEIFKQMTQKGKTDPQEWKDNKYLHEQFFKELAQAEKLPRVVSLKHYVPNTPLNRKRLVAATLEDHKIEPTKENFVGLYKKMKYENTFSKVLASNLSEVGRKRVELARMHAASQRQNAK